MKLVCSRKDLVDAIDFVVPVAAVRSPQPLFQSIRFEADGSNLTLLACDGEMWAQMTLMADVEEAGSVCVQGRVLKELIGALPDGPVNLTVEGGNMQVTAGSSDWKLMAFPSGDFPDMPEFTPSSAVELKVSELNSAIDSVSYAVATDNSRAVLTGVMFSYDGSHLQLVATDTHRLAVTRLSKPEMGEPINAIVPEKALRVMKGMGLDDNESIRIELDDTRLVVDAGNARLVSQLLTGSYPQWQRVVPEQFTRTWTMDRAELIDNLKRTLIIARDSSNRICFGGDNDHVTMTARSDEKGQAHEECAAVNDNGEIEIAFNGKYVLDAIQSFKGDSVVAQMTEPSRPAVFKPSDSEGQEHFCVIMPMSLS